jgi:glycosyltransferase involved in cell wall biosynthesis
VPFIALRRIVRYSWEPAVLSLQLGRAHPALVHSLGYVAPLAAKGPHVVSVHNLNYLGHTGRRTGAGRRAFRFFVEQTVKRAAHVITISEFSRGEFVKHLPVSADKVSVIHFAGREEDEGAAPGQARAVKPPVSGPYIMAFGSLSAHKNLGRLVAGFNSIASLVPHSLVLVGHLPEKPTFRAELEQAGNDRVKLTVYLPESEVQALIANASLFAFPSLYEGFDMPILDAQHAGVPIACSNAAALPEVAGEGAYLFDPYSVEAIAKALKACLLDTDVRADLVRKGYANPARFSWDKTPRETLAVYAPVAK